MKSKQLKIIGYLQSIALEMISRQSHKLKSLLKMLKIDNNAAIVKQLLASF